MANYIAIPRDLSKVKTKVLFNLTKRQLICFGSGAAVGLPVFFISRYFKADISSAVMYMMVVMIPFFLFAMFEKNGQPLEKLLRQIIQCKFKRPKIRPYKTNNYYTCLLRQAALRKEAERLVSKGSVQKQNTTKGGCSKHGAGIHPVPADVQGRHL